MQQSEYDHKTLSITAEAFFKRIVQRMQYRFGGYRMNIRYKYQKDRHQWRVSFIALLCALILTSCSFARKDIMEKPSGQDTIQKQDDKATVKEPAKAPVIEKQPDSIKVVSKDPVHFSVTVNGTKPLKYQWQKNDHGSTEWKDIKGADKTCYIIMRTKQGMSGTRYRCIVSNSAGQAISNEAVLTVTDGKS